MRVSRGDPWWVAEAQIALTIEQAELLSDDDAAGLLADFTDLAWRDVPAN
ncbi:hypothetical protein [Nucisporomicrobium flavum]|nr:hypothetical protein [Nucisporomicrobium flavum]